MNVAKDTVVTFHYSLMDDKGVRIESSENHEPMAVLIGHGNILLGIEDAMKGKSINDKISVTLSPEKAYGLRREDAVQRVPIKHISSKGKLVTGSQVIINTEQGGRNATVIKVGKFNVDVDTNHPMAGKTIVFDLTIVDVRAAIPEEISHGHAHGAGGHHH